MLVVPSRFLTRHWPCLFALFATLLVYFPLTRVYFWSDDFSNLVTIENRGFSYLVTSEPGGGHCSFFGDVLFYVPYLLFGLRPEPFGWIALSIHVVNVVLIYRVGLRLIRARPVLAGLAALVWGTCSLHSEALDWLCVNEHALAGTALLLVLDRVAEGRREISGRDAVVWSVILWCGATSFRNGAAVAAAFPFVLPLLTEHPYRRVGPRIALAALPAIVFLTYYGSRLYFVRHFESVSVITRIMPALAFFYVSPVFEMTGHMISTGVLGLVRGVTFVPGEDPTYGRATIALLALSCSAIVAGFISANPAARRRMLALGVFALSAYGAIAVGRANFYVMFYRITPEVAGRTVRYHYLGTIPLVLILLEAASSLLRSARFGVAANVGAMAAGFSWFAFGYSTRTWKLDEHEGCRKSVEAGMNEIDALVDASPPGSTVTVEDREPACAIRDATLAGVFSITHESDQVRGRTVRFRWDQAKFPRFADPKNRRLSKLVVPRGASPFPEAGLWRASDMEPICSKMGPEMEKVRVALGCAKSDWPLWRVICDTAAEQTECLAPLSRAASCYVAQPATTWHCDERGTLRWLLAQEPVCGSEWAELDACLR